MRPLCDGDPLALGPWILRNRLGQGGMGTVFLARDVAGRTAAVKVINSGMAADPTAMPRFMREVAVMRVVTSPMVARVLDADVSATPPWLAMEYVPGADLDQHVKLGGPLMEAAWDSVAGALLHAVAALHDAGVVHRDLKPANVILADGAPKIIDFGLAMSVGDTRITRAGLLMGSPGWMAPEQWSGELAGAPADVFAVGALLAYAGTGRPPFGSGTDGEMRQRVATTPIDVDGLDARRSDLVRWLTQKEPGRRPTAGDAARAWIGGTGADAARTVVQSWSEVKPTLALPSHRSPARGPAAVPSSGWMTAVQRWWASARRPRSASLVPYLLVPLAAAVWLGQLGDGSVPAATASEPRVVETTADDAPRSTASPTARPSSADAPAQPPTSSTDPTRSGTPAPSSAALAQAAPASPPPTAAPTPAPRTDLPAVPVPEPEVNTVAMAEEAPHRVANDPEVAIDVTDIQTGTAGPLSEVYVDLTMVGPPNHQVIKGNALAADAGYWGTSACLPMSWPDESRWRIGGQTAAVLRDIDWRTLKFSFIARGECELMAPEAVPELLTK